MSPAQPFTGKLSLNNRLDEVEIWHKGDFAGPESFADLDNALYTSLNNGDVVKLTGNLGKAYLFQTANYLPF